MVRLDKESAGAAAHGAIGQEERHAVLMGEAVKNVTDPDKVRIVALRGAIFPARVAFELRVPPFAHIERGLTITVDAQVGGAEI